MASKAKNKTAKPKVVSQKPRKSQSRPVWALLFLTFAVMVGVAILFYNSNQFNATDPVDPNPVGPFGSHIGFYGFHYLGVAVFLLPLYLLWVGVRFLLQQRPRKRIIVGLLSIVSLCCASGLAAMLGDIETASKSIFRDQLSNGYGGIVGDWMADRLLVSYIGSFGAFLVLMMGLVISSIIVFTDNLGRFLDWLQNSYHNFFAARAESKEARQQRKTEAAAAKRLAKEEAARIKAEAKADKAAAKSKKTTKADRESELGEAPDRESKIPVRKPSLLSGAPTLMTKPPAGRKLRKASAAPALTPEP